MGSTPVAQTTSLHKRYFFGAIPLSVLDLWLSVLDLLRILGLRHNTFMSVLHTLWNSLPDSPLSLLVLGLASVSFPALLARLRPQNCSSARSRGIRLDVRTRRVISIAEFRLAGRPASRYTGQGSRCAVMSHKAVSF
jgi:hypothetical protein